MVCTAFHKLKRLVRVTSPPTRKYMVFSGNLPTNLAAMGAAITPPIISPNTSAMGMCFNRIKKVTALANTTKNSARQTEPIT
jgi:hypothetical protein